MTLGIEPRSWATAGSAAFGVPEVILAGERTIADLATATAGFRDQFYGFVPFVAELDGRLLGSQDLAPLVTVGMIDVLDLAWQRSSFKFAKTSYRQPAVDLAALEREDPRLARWVTQRRRPKVLVATQTRVIEPWVDVAGTVIPATPVMSLEPRDSDDLWLLAAALVAPSVSARCAAMSFGSALTVSAIKVSASDLLSLPLPHNRGPWQEAAALVREVSAEELDNARPTIEKLAAIGQLMGRAYGANEETVAWWRSRLPSDN